MDRVRVSRALGLAIVMLSLALVAASGCSRVVPASTATKPSDGASSYELAVQYEDEIAVCMARAGFEYVAAPPPQPAEDLVPSLLAETERSVVATYGYGISTEIEPGGVGHVEVSTDPNALYYLSLDEDGRDAYDRALYGSDDGGSCRDDAHQVVYGSIRLQQDGDLSGDALQRALSNRGFRDALGAWSRCFADVHGRVLASPDYVPAIVEEALGAAEIPFDETVEDPDEDPGSLEIVFVPSYDPTLLEEVQRLEVALALTDYDCQVRVGLLDAYKEALVAASDGG